MHPSTHLPRQVLNIEMRSLTRKGNQHAPIEVPNPGTYPLRIRQEPVGNWSEFSKG